MAKAVASMTAAAILLGLPLPIIILAFLMPGCNR